MSCFVDMEAPGCAIRIERGAKRADDSVPDRLNEGCLMPPAWEEDKFSAPASISTQLQ